MLALPKTKPILMLKKSNASNSEDDKMEFIRRQFMKNKMHRNRLDDVVVFELGKISAISLFHVFFNYREA